MLARHEMTILPERLIKIGSGRKRVLFSSSAKFIKKMPKFFAQYLCIVTDCKLVVRLGSVTVPGFNGNSKRSLYKGRRFSVISIVY